MRAASVKATESRRRLVATSFEVRTSPRGMIILGVILHFPPHLIAFLEMHEGLVHFSNMRTWRFSKEWVCVGLKKQPVHHMRSRTCRKGDWKTLTYSRRHRAIAQFEGPEMNLVCFAALGLQRHPANKEYKQCDAEVWVARSPLCSVQTRLAGTDASPPEDQRTSSVRYKDCICDSEISATLLMFSFFPPICWAGMDHQTERRFPRWRGKDVRLNALLPCWNYPVAGVQKGG